MNLAASDDVHCSSCRGHPGRESGSGTIQITGRVVTGSSDAGIIYAPRTTRSGVSSLSPN